MSERTNSTTDETNGVLDTLESKFDAFEERIGLRTYTAQTTVAKAVVYYIAATMATGSAAAQNEGAGSEICGDQLGGFIRNMLGLLFGAGFVAAIYAIIRSSIKYMNAGGNPMKKSEARDSLMMSFIGMGLLLFVTFLPGFLNTLVDLEIVQCVDPFYGGDGGSSSPGSS